MLVNVCQENMNMNECVCVWAWVRACVGVRKCVRVCLCLFVYKCSCVQLTFPTQGFQNKERGEHTVQPPPLTICWGLLAAVQLSCNNIHNTVTDHSITLQPSSNNTQCAYQHCLLSTHHHVSLTTQTQLSPGMFSYISPNVLPCLEACRFSNRSKFFMSGTVKYLHKYVLKSVSWWPDT